MHVVDVEKWPLSATAAYQPPSHTLDDARSALTRQLGIEKMVIVQPSIYANDNNCTLEGVQGLGISKGRGVIQFDAQTTTSEQLQAWHDDGARGVRLNFKSVGAKVTSEDLAKSLHQYVNAVRGLNWIVQIYIAMEDIPLLEPIIPQLDSGVKICIDHVGHPSPESLAHAKTAYDLPGFASFAKLLQQGQTWTKLSATYRLHKDPRAPAIEALCREVIRLRPDRCVFATDWPHTRFDGIDVVPYLEAVLDWIQVEGVPLEQVLVKNAEILFDAQP